MTETAEQLKLAYDEATRRANETTNTMNREYYRGMQDGILIALCAEMDISNDLANKIQQFANQPTC